MQDKWTNNDNKQQNQTHKKLKKIDHNIDLGSGLWKENKRCTLHSNAFNCIMLVVHLKFIVLICCFFGLPGAIVLFDSWTF